MELKPFKSAAGERPLLLFQDHSWKGLLQGAAFFGVIALAAFGPFSGRMNYGLALIPALMAGSFFFLGIRRSLFIERPWILMKTKDTLLVNPAFSGGHGPHLPPDTLIVLRDQDIHSLCYTCEVFQVAHRFGATRHHFISLDIRLHHPPPEEIRQRIEERQKAFRTTGKEGPFPLRLPGSRILRINWAWITPPEKEAEKQLGIYYPVAQRRKVIYPALELLDGDLKRFYMAQLWKMGMTREAAFLNNRFFRLAEDDLALLQQQLDGDDSRES